MDRSEHLNMPLPGYVDPADIVRITEALDILDENARLTDAELANKVNKGGNSSAQVGYQNDSVPEITDVWSAITRLFGTKLNTSPILLFYPTIVSQGANFTYSKRDGYCVKVNGLVVIQFSVVINNWKTSGASIGALWLDNVPYAQESDIPQFIRVWSDNADWNTQIYGLSVAANGRLSYHTLGGGYDVLLPSNIPQSATFLALAGCYTFIDAT